MKTRKHESWQNNPKLAGCFSEIERFGGQTQVAATTRALSDMKVAIAQNVASTPDAFGANQQPESQAQATDKIMAHVCEQYVKQLAGDLRRKSGYVALGGLWVHRSVVTFFVYGLLAAMALTIFIPMIFSPKAGRFGWGSAGLLATLGIGIAIFLRIRN